MFLQELILKLFSISHLLIIESLLRDGQPRGVSIVRDLVVPRLRHHLAVVRPQARYGGGRGSLRVQLPVVLLLVAVHPAHFPPLFAHKHIRGTRTRVVLLHYVRHDDLR